jgi:hypothetical protein
MINAVRVMTFILSPFRRPLGGKRLEIENVLFVRRSSRLLMQLA